MIDMLKGALAGVDNQALLSMGGRALVVLILAWAALAVVKAALRRFEARLVAKAMGEDKTPTEASKRAETLSRLVRQSAIIVIWVVAGLILLSELGVDIGPILASAGIVGLAVGFGAQNLVRDVISGFFLVLENQVRVGDVAKVNGTGGVVEELNLRTLVLRDLAGTVHIFPNGAITTLSNLTKEWSGYVMEIGVAYKENTDRATEIMRKVGEELRKDEYFGPLIIEDIEVFGVDQFADSAVVIKARIKTKPIKQWEVGRQYLRRLKMAFDSEGIEIPFPHRSIYFGEASNPIVTQLVAGEGSVTSQESQQLGAQPTETRGAA